MDTQSPSPSTTSPDSTAHCHWEPLSLHRVLLHFQAQLPPLAQDAATLRAGRSTGRSAGPSLGRSAERHATHNSAHAGHAGLRLAQSVEEAAVLPEERNILRFLHAVFGGSDATIQLYARYVVGLLNHARQPAAAIDAAHVDDYLRDFEARGAKPATCAAIAASLKSFFRHMVDSGHMSHNPMALQRKYKGRGKAVLAGHLSHSLSRDDLEQLVSGLRAVGATERDQALFVLLFMTGLRAEEVATLRWAQLANWQGQYYLDVQGKGAKARRVYVPTPALTALLHYRKTIPGLHCAPHPVCAAAAELPLLGHLRDARKHLTRHGIYALVKKWCAALLHRPDVSPHWFRHSCFTQLALKGVPLEAIKNLAGHESVETTMRYNEAAALMEAPGKAFE